MKATFVDDIDTALAMHRDKLHRLKGRKLAASWIVWDRDHDSWFADEPVVLDFQGCVLEIVFWKFNELSLTWNNIDLQQPPNWYGCYDGLNLEWRCNAHPALESVVGRSLSNVSLVEMLNEIGITQLGEWLLHAIQFHFEPLTLTVFNALDENGMSNDVLTHPRYRTVTIARES